MLENVTSWTTLVFILMLTGPICGIEEAKLINRPIHASRRNIEDKDIFFKPASTTHPQTSNDTNQLKASIGASESNLEVRNRRGSKVGEGHGNKEGKYSTQENVVCYICQSDISSLEDVRLVHQPKNCKHWTHIQCFQNAFNRGYFRCGCCRMPFGIKDVIQIFGKQRLQSQSGIQERARFDNSLILFSSFMKWAINSNRDTFMKLFKSELLRCGINYLLYLLYAYHQRDETASLLYCYSSWHMKSSLPRNLDQGISNSFRFNQRLRFLAISSMSIFLLFSGLRSIDSAILSVITSLYIIGFYILWIINS